MFDASHETFEMLKRPDTVQIIAIQGDRIIVTSELQPAAKRELGFLGGRVDEGETPLECAQRELLEEAGLKAKAWELFKIYEPHVKMDWKVYFFIARGCRQVTEPHLDAGEKIKILKVSFVKFISLIASGKYKGGEFVSDVLRMRIEGELKKFRSRLFPLLVRRGRRRS